METLYLSELFEKYQLTSELKKGMFNQLTSECGSGKSMFIAKYISEHLKNGTKILYITDSKMNVKAFCKKFYDFHFSSDNFNNDSTEEMVLDYLSCETTINSKVFYVEGRNKLSIKNFNYVSTMIEHQSDFLSQFEIIIFDELQEIFWRENCKVLIDEIPSILDQNLIISLSATPRLIWGHYRDIQDKFKDILKPYQSELKSYSIEKTHIIDDFTTYNFSLLKGHKFIFYTTRVREQLQFKQLMIESGLKVDFICSDNHQSFTEYMTKIKNHIIEYNKIPDHLDGLIINASANTGLDFTGIEIVMVNSGSSDLITQVRGRVRHDLSLLLHKPKSDKQYKLQEFDNNLYNIQQLLIDYGNIPLFKEQQIELLFKLYNLGFSHRCKPLKTLKKFKEIYDERYNDNEIIECDPFEFELKSGKWKSRDSNRDKQYTIINI